MKNNRNTTIRMFVSIVILIIFGISFISAFSISAPYMENKELKLFPNSGITDLEFVLQNGGATEDVNVKVSILEGSEIASLLEESDIYTVSPGEQVKVNLRINIPENSKIGESYDIKLGFGTVSSGRAGEFGFGTEIEQNFKVRIIGEEKEKNTKLVLYLTIAIVLILLIIVLVIKIKKKK